MSGSSSSGFYPWRRRQPPASLSNTDINECLQDLLRAYNDRDTEAVRRHLDVLCDSLALTEDDAIHTLFGGSVSRHTAINGLSDVDILAIINESSLSGQSPSAVLQQMAQRIAQRLPQTNVSIGDLAVTVKYSDGVEIQVLPAIRTNSGVRIGDPDTNQWSNVLHPERFARKLTEVNQANNGRVIPTVKLAKGLASRIISSDRDKISGYHLESLAVDAVKNYNGPNDLRSMFRHFVAFSSRAVEGPISDSTGQSRHVDGYMGPEGSMRRRRASQSFRTMLRHFDACNSRQDFDNLFAP